MDSRRIEIVRRKQSLVNMLQSRGSSRRPRGRALPRPPKRTKSGAASSAPPHADGTKPFPEPRDMASFLETYRGVMRPVGAAEVDEWVIYGHKRLVRCAGWMVWRRYRRHDDAGAFDAVTTLISQACEPGVLRRLDPSRLPARYFHKWLWRIVARPLAQERFEKRQLPLGEREGEREAPFATPDRILSGQETLDRVLDAMCSLPTRSRRVLLARTSREGSTLHHASIPRRRLHRFRVRRALLAKIPEAAPIAQVRRTSGRQTERGPRNA